MHQVLMPYYLVRSAHGFWAKMDRRLVGGLSVHMAQKFGTHDGAAYFAAEVIGFIDAQERACPRLLDQAVYPSVCGPFVHNMGEIIFENTGDPDEDLINALQALIDTTSFPRVLYALSSFYADVRPGNTWAKELGDHLALAFDLSMLDYTQPVNHGDN